VKRGAPAIDPRLKVVTENPANAEAPLDLQRGIITPNDLFFMRNRFSFPEIDAAAWRLTVSGPVGQPLSLSYDDLLAMPSRSFPATLECAGNGRSGMEPMPEGEPWEYGAVSTAEWTGVPLHLVLETAGLSEGVTAIVAEGQDGGFVSEARGEERFARSLPLDKALHPDTLLAYTMNGEPLPVAHGFPVRLLVPGWYGMASVKWVTTLRAINDAFDGFFQVERYVMREPGSDGPPPPVTQMGVRSIITTPRPGAAAHVGTHLVRGYAWSGAAPVTEIEVSTDGGNTWQPAQWTSGEARYAWRSWEFRWSAETPGQVLLQSRARDAAGNQQPSSAPWNDLGYCNNGIQVVQVDVV
jgi:DMSO/TMAO reductase YedYZ molybdopterin-dependent catalytic subunit